MCKNKPNVHIKIWFFTEIFRTHKHHSSFLTFFGSLGRGLFLSSSSGPLSVLLVSCLSVLPVPQKINYFLTNKAKRKLLVNDGIWGYRDSNAIIQFCSRKKMTSKTFKLFQYISFSTHTQIAVKQLLWGGIELLLDSSPLTSTPSCLRAVYDTRCGCNCCCTAATCTWLWLLRLMAQMHFVSAEARYRVCDKKKRGGRVRRQNRIFKQNQVGFPGKEVICIYIEEILDVLQNCCMKYSIYFLIIFPLVYTMERIYEAREGLALKSK